MFEFKDRGDRNWDCGYLLDAFCKFGGGISQGADEAVEDLKGTGCQMLHLCSRETYKESWRETKEGFEYFWDDPGGALGDMWDGLIDPFSTNQENNNGIGGFFKNLGYSATQVVGGPLKLLRPFGGNGTPNGNGRNSDRDGSNCTPNSFPPGVLVLLVDGTAVPIEEVSVGDQVLAADPYTGEQAAHEVTHLITGYGEKALTEISVDDGSGQSVSVTATDNHPFWVPDQGWTDAADLEPGTWLRTSAGTWVQVSAVETRAVPDQRVHNLTIEDLHTYHVLAGQTALLVHNSSWCTDEERLEDANDIATGHADGKHKGDFPGLSVKDLTDLTQDVIQNPSRTKELGSGRKAFLGKDGSTIVLHDPMNPDGGTIYRVDPAELEDYWERLN